MLNLRTARIIFMGLILFCADSVLLCQKNSSTLGLCNPCNTFKISITTLKACPNKNFPNAAGFIIVGMLGGTPPFVTTINNSEISTNSNFYSTKAVDAGSYVVKVVDAVGCSEEKTVTVGPLPENLCNFVNCQVIAEAASIPVSLCANNLDQGLIAVGVYKAAGPIDVIFYKDNQIFYMFSSIAAENFPSIFTQFPNGTYEVEVIDTSFKTTPCKSTRTTVIVDNSCSKPLRCSNISSLLCCCR